MADDSLLTGGVLGEAALGALQGATPIHNTTSPPPSPSNPASPIYLDEQGNPISSPTPSPAPTPSSGYLDEQGNPTTAPVTSAKEIEDANKAAQVAIEQSEAASMPGGEMALGAVKGALRTADTIARFFHPGPQGDIEKELTTPSDPLQKVGNFGEDVMEFLAGDEALKTLSIAKRFGVASKIAEFAEKSPRIAKALNIGMNAMRQGGVSAAQTMTKGGTIGEAGENAAITGTVSATLGTFGAAASALYNSIAGKTPEAIALAKQAAADTGTDLASQISNRPVGSALEGAQEVKSLLGKAEDQMHAGYAQGLDQIEKKIPDLLVDISGSSLQKTSQELLSNPEVPEELQAAMKGIIPEASRIQPLLEEFATGNEYSWSGIQATRKAIGNTIRDLPFDSPLRHDLITIRGAIDDTMQKAVDKAGQPEISKELQDLRSVYAEQIRAFESTAIKTLADKNPNAVADVLLNKQSVFNINTLRQLIGPKAMQPVEGQLLKRLIDRASINATNEFNPASFVRQFTNLGPDVQHAIWGENLPKIFDFLSVVKNVPKDSPFWNKLASYMEHRAMFDVLLGGVAFGGLFGAGEIKGERLLAPAAILAGVLMLHSAAALNTASKILQGLSAATVPSVAAGEQMGTSKTEEPNKEQSENLPELPPGHSHIRTSDGSEFYIPNEHLDRAREIDTGLQLLNQVEQNKSHMEIPGVIDKTEPGGEIALEPLPNVSKA